MFDFKTMSNVQSVLRNAIFELTNSATPRLDAEVLLVNILKIDRPKLYRDSGRPLSEPEIEFFQHCIERRKKGEPVAYITGWKEFWSLPFRVNRHVLIPRPETEILVEEVVRICQDRPQDRVLEIGTGSGAISVAVAAAVEGINITATDISEEALMVASENAALNGVADQIMFLQGNLFEPVQGQFNLIMSNPPYIAEGDFEQLPIGVRGFEPAGALVAGVEGTEFHQTLIEGACQYLQSGGWLVMELGAGQEKQIGEFLARAHFSEIDFIKDYAGYCRVVKGRRD